MPFVARTWVENFVVPVALQAGMGSFDFVQDDKRGLVNGFSFRPSLGLGRCKK